MSAARRPELLLVFACWAWCSCGPIVKRGHFTERPTTVRRVFPLGPFEGRVEDSGTAKPLEGALVQATWQFERGIGSATSYAVRTQQTKTDPDGRYRVARLRSLPAGLSTRLARFTLQVYRPGYVTYRSDTQFPAARPRIDFTQYDNAVRLVRWQPHLSHAKHLLFSGGSAAFRRATSWERTNAARELDGLAAASDAEAKKEPGLAAALDQSQNLDTPRLAEAQRLLTDDDVRRVTGFDGSFGRQPLRDPGDASSSVHLRAEGRPERFDAALRLWTLAEDQLGAKYDALHQALPQAKDSDEVGDRAFITTQGEIRGICFVAAESGAVALLTCGKGLCASMEQLLELARAVEQRLVQSASTPGPGELLPLEEMSE